VGFRAVGTGTGGFLAGFGFSGHMGSGTRVASGGRGGGQCGGEVMGGIGDEIQYLKVTATNGWTSGGDGGPNLGRHG